MIRTLCIGLIRAYQLGVSPFLGSHCRFHPSCSSYALEAFQTYSFLKALGLTLKRLFRCHPYCEGGFDPLPEPKTKNG